MLIQVLVQRTNSCLTNCACFVKRTVDAYKIASFYKIRALETYFYAFSAVSEPSGVHLIFGETVFLVKIWLYKMLLLYGASGFKLSRAILYQSKFLVPILFAMPHILCLQKAGCDPHGLISTGMQHTKKV